MNITELEILLEETDNIITQTNLCDDYEEARDLLNEYCELWGKIYDVAKANPDLKDSEEFTKMDNTYKYIYLSISGKVNLEEFDFRNYYY